MASKTPVSVWKNPIHFLAFGLGSGAAPKAPGTFGTLAAVVIYYFIQDLSLLYYAIFLLVSFGFGVYLCDKTSKDIGVHDHGGIVWDEFVGYWLTMWMAPSGWEWIVVGFVFFRLYDIWKPWPIGWLDSKVSGGFGVMIDDVVAGIYAWLSLQICYLLTH